MNAIWFKRWGWIHLPVTVPGFLIVTMALAFCVQVFLAVDRHSHSVSDTVYGVFPYVVPCLLSLDWLASRTSGNGADVLATVPAGGQRNSL